MSGLFGGGGSPAAREPVRAAQTKTTAAPVEQLSETAKKNRQRAAAFNPRGFAPPKLGQAGLLGVSSQ